MTNAITNTLTLPTYLQSRYRSSTAAAYLREIDTLLTNWPAAAVASYSDVVAYMGTLRQRYTNGATLRRMLAGIKVFYDYLVACGQRTDHPARSLVLKDQRHDDVQLQDLLAETELEALLQIRARYKALAYRNRVLMSLLVYQALLPSEIAALRVEDIDLEAGTITTAGSGSTTARTLALQAPQMLLFYAWVVQVRPGLAKVGNGAENAFIVGLRGNGMSAEDIVKHVLRAYKNTYAPRRVSALRIRQSVIANKLAAGVPLHLVQGFAGHRYPSSTERYRPDGDGALQSAIALYHPLG